MELFPARPQNYRSKSSGKFTYTDIPITADSPFCSLVKKYNVPCAEPSIPKPLRTRQSSLDGPSDSEEREEPSSSVTDSYTSTTTTHADAIRRVKRKSTLCARSYIMIRKVI